MGLRQNVWNPLSHASHTSILLPFVDMPQVWHCLQSGHCQPALSSGEGVIEVWRHLEW